MGILQSLPEYLISNLDTLENLTQNHQRYTYTIKVHWL